MRKAWVVISLAVSVGTGAAWPATADEAACATFKWPMAREQAWLQAAHPALATGGTLPVANGAFSLALSPVESVSFGVAPYHKPPAGTFGAAVSTTVEHDGMYQVTLSGEGWIDVVQAGKSIKSAGYSGVKGCPGMRKSVRFDLKAGPATIEVSGVKASAIDVAVGPAT
ncbi:hypothetical protein [Labrys monachus]|uniref:Homogentisate 1,2-dioxygenase n=1 Tax=Labrys monachus TaxID=217067 RepID=A0ABU0FA78_9HYPH|nr:hypothetical protein [Labrys monachus]MDQ0391526.1 hypothetical protein [Labrys monachus]